jgi:hypothetical protein
MYMYVNLTSCNRPRHGNFNLFPMHARNKNQIGEKERNGERGMASGEWRVARRQMRREEGGGRGGRRDEDEDELERNEERGYIQYSTVKPRSPPDPIPDSRIRPPPSLLSPQAHAMLPNREQEQRASPTSNFFGTDKWAANPNGTRTHAPQTFFIYIFSHTRSMARYGVPSSWPCGLGMRACVSWDVHAYMRTFVFVCIVLYTSH